jgi:hypothetical protein
VGSPPGKVVRFYRVRWWGYGQDQDTWEPRESLDQPLEQYAWEDLGPEPGGTGGRRRGVQNLR